jgi:hypothetical protein
VVLGAGLIGWVGGETIVGDNVLKDLLGAQPWLHYAGAALGAVIVVGIGKGLQSRARMEAARS